MKACFLFILILFSLAWHGCSKFERDNPYDEKGKLPEVSTAAVSNITAITAICGGTVTRYKALSRGVCWDTIQNPTIEQSHTSDGSGSGAFTSNITGLSPHTTYYVRAYATNAAGTAYGSEQSFTTQNGVIMLTTTAITGITATAAISGGNITSDGGFPVTARGVCWSTSQSPTIANPHTSDGSGTGTFTSNITGLSPNTTYYVRAYATNAAGTAYGSEQSFTTQNGVIMLTTTAITGITATAAISGGNITSDGGFPVTARGVCWSTSQSPTIAGSHISNGSGTGAFTSNINGLSSNTTYYVRAYATNAAGTTYGNQLSFTSNGTGSPVTDVDGNNYATIWIGGQNWMQENLKTTHYRDGAPIQPVTDNTTWASMTSGAYCYYNNNTSYGNTYGALYNWYTVNTGKLCPTGWHVPSDAEWTMLTDYLGGASVAGGKLKEAGTAHWQSPNTGATNSSGFTALPGGDRNNSSGNFNDMGNYGYWWSSAESNTIGAWFRFMSYNSANVYRGNYYKVDGLSVRCLRD